MLSLKNRALRKDSEELRGPELGPERETTQRMCQIIPGNGSSVSKRTDEKCVVHSRDPEETRTSGKGG